MSTETQAGGNGATSATGTAEQLDGHRQPHRARAYELPITDGTIRAMDLRQIKAGDDDFGLMIYDPAFMNTASCRSAITYIDGDKGILRVPRLPDRAARGEEHLPRDRPTCSLHGELPTGRSSTQWMHEITIHTIVHENIKKFMEGFRYDAHPMGMLVGTVAALSTFYPDAKRHRRPGAPAAADRSG